MVSKQPEVWVRFGPPRPPNGQPSYAEVPAIPERKLLLDRWACDHRWTPHVHLPEGWHSILDWDCWRCGATYENAIPPVDGTWPLRARIARLIAQPSAT